MATPGAALPAGTAQQAISFLLSRNFLLAALELLQEAREAGLGHEVESLAEFFRDASLFPPEQVAACNPENAVNFVEVAHQRQQQLSLLQHQLAVAQEDLAALRAAAAASAAAGTAADAAAAAGGEGGGGTAGGAAGGSQKHQPDAASGPLSAAQRAEVNRAVLAHLHAQGFKLAALSLGKEAGLPLPAPAATDGGLTSLSAWFAAAQQLPGEVARRQELEGAVEEQLQQLAALQQQLQESQEREEAAAAELEFVRNKLAAAQEQAEQAAAAAAEAERQLSLSAQGSGQQQQSQRLSGAASLPASLPSLPAPPALAANASSALVEVAACMPKVLPNLLINKRDELVPVLSALCAEHPEPASRRKLAGLLFGLIKKPNEAQRAMIATACASLARRIGARRAMLDLWPHLAEQAHHELVERRLLVADTAGALAGQLLPAQAGPVLQLLEALLLGDGQPQVRCHALAALAGLCSHLSQQPASLGEVLRLLLAAARDGSGDVTHLLLGSALPALLEQVSASQPELLVTQLLPQTLAELRQALDRCPPASEAGQGAGPAAAAAGEASDGQQGPRAVPPAVQNHAITLLHIFCAALPALRDYALSSQPQWVGQAAAAPADVASSPAGADAHEGSQAAEPAGVSSDSIGGSEAAQAAEVHAAIDRSLQEQDGGHLSMISGGGPAAAAEANGSGSFERSHSQEQAGAALAAAEQHEPAVAAAGLPQGQQQLEAAAFAAWVAGRAGREEWRALDYLALKAMPALIRAALLVSSAAAAALLLQRFTAALKSTCLSFGEAFAAAVVAPQLRMAAGIPPWTQPGPPLPSFAGTLPAAPPQQPGLGCALPLLLAGVLPYAGNSAVGACLRRLCTSDGGGEGAWALEHPQAFVAAVRSAAEVQLVQAQLVPLCWELVACKQQGPRIAAALLAGAAAPALFKQQVTRQLLPLLAVLGADKDGAVCRASIAAAAVVFASFSEEADVQEALFSTLDDVLVHSGHVAEVALLAVLAPAAAAASPQQLEWLLQRIQLMLAALHQREAGGKSAEQLAEAAVTAFAALRQIEGHEFTDRRLHMHFAAALAALQREGSLLEQSQRDALAAMLEDHEVAMAGAGGHAPRLSSGSVGASSSAFGSSGGAQHQSHAWSGQQQQQQPTGGAAATGGGQASLAALFATDGGGAQGMPIGSFLGQQ